MKRYTVYIVGKDHPFVFNGEPSPLPAAKGWCRYKTDRGEVVIQDVNVGAIEEQVIEPA